MTGKSEKLLVLQEGLVIGFAVGVAVGFAVGAAFGIHEATQVTRKEAAQRMLGQYVVDPVTGSKSWEWEEYTDD